MEKFLKFLIFQLILKSSFSVKINCYYYNVYDGPYRCLMNDLFNNPIEATSVSKNHVENKSSSDVKSFFVPYNTPGTEYYPFLMCSKFVNLEEMNLRSASAVELKSNVFVGCEKLREIHIVYLKLDELDENLLKDIPTLEIFEIFGTRIKILQKDFFKYNQALKEVFIDSNYLRTIEVDFPTNLRILLLKDNHCPSNYPTFRVFVHDDPTSTPLEKLINDVKRLCTRKNF